MNTIIKTVESVFPINKKKLEKLTFFELWLLFLFSSAVYCFSSFFLFCHIITYFKLYLFEYNSQTFSFALLCRIFIPFTVFDALTLVSAVLTRKYFIRVYGLFHATTYTVQNITDKFLKTASFFFSFKSIKRQSIFENLLIGEPLPTCMIASHMPRCESRIFSFF